MTTILCLTVNGAEMRAEAAADLRLVDLLRDRLGLMGTRTGCETAQCGACTVHPDGAPVRACTLLAWQAEGGRVTTIEAIGTAMALHPMQAAFRDRHALQCGYCTPGMVMTALALVAASPDPTEAEIRHALKGNICRCTGYRNILAAIRDGAARLRGEDCR